MCTRVPLCNWASMTPGTHTILPDRRLLICRWNNSLENFYQRQKKKHKNSSFLFYMPHYTEIGNSLLGEIIICRTNLWCMWTGKYRSQFNRCCLCFHKLTTPAIYHHNPITNHTHSVKCVCACACAMHQSCLAIKVSPLYSAWSYQPALKWRALCRRNG